MKKYDHIVIGSGISGLTMSLILAANGRKVLLLEKNPRIGGSMSRFYKKGIPFDTGFHFTGGLHEGGILDDILSVLGIRDLIEPVYLSEDNANCFLIEPDNKYYEIPYGIKNIKSRLKGYFPGEAGAIDRYFDKVQHVCDSTPSLNLKTLNSQQEYLNEDSISLEDVLKSLTRNPMLKTILSFLAMCYGVKPVEISFANHSRICQNLYESVARVKGGGDSFIKAFESRFKDLDIEISCKRHIVELADINNRKVGRFILNTGEEVSADSCIFTIHPMEILKILPREHLSRAFVDRIYDFESSTGFFTVFAALDPAYHEPDFGAKIVSLLPHNDVNRLLDPECIGSSALGLFKSVKQVKGKTYRTINIFEPSFLNHCELWKDSKIGKRPRAYQDYKINRVENIMKRIFIAFPDYKERLEVVDAASVLTFRDYLNNPDGSAYGIKQKLNQLNLIGKLPLHNLYAAGQSALLPGIIGAMMSSLLVGRSLISEEKYNKFLNRNLCS